MHFSLFLYQSGIYIRVNLLRNPILHQTCSIHLSLHS